MDTLTQTKPDTFMRFRLPEELYKRVRIEAINRSVSLQQLCTEALTHYLDQTAAVEAK